MAEQTNQVTNEPRLQFEGEMNNLHSYQIPSLNHGDVVWADEMPSNPSESEP